MKVFLFLLTFFSIIFSRSFSFELENIDEGVYVHFGKQEDSNKLNTGDIANIGFIVGSESIAVIDTGASVKIGKKMYTMIKKISKLPISHIIITHSHPDHFMGTEAFIKDKPIIIGHENLNRSLINNFEFYKALQFNLTKDESIKSTKLVLANKLIKKNDLLKINLGGKHLIIKAWSSGHTDNDLSIYDENSKIFWSENIFVDRIPSIRASIKGWKKNLNEILKLDIKKIVPGHGPIMSKNEAISPMISYFDQLVSEVRDFHKKNKSLDYVLKNIGNENKQNWLLYKEYHMTNVTKTFTELEWE